MVITKKELWELPEPLSEPKVVEGFFPDEMFARVKNAINSIGLGTDSLKYHTMIGRWESDFRLDSDIEEYCVNKAREIFGDESLQKAYFFAVRYQIKDGCIPHLWEHTDQNGTQTTIDITIENSANWGLLVEGVHYEQKENDAIVFAGQQHMHARPPYPTDSEDVWTTVIFLHFTQPDHWIQKDSHGIRTYGSDGDVRFFNKNRYMAMPDPPVRQPVCACHDYSTTLMYYDKIVGSHVDGEPELVDCTIIDRELLAPGIMRYSFGRSSARVLKGLTQNAMFKRWENAMVLSNGEKVVDYGQRNCFEVALGDVHRTCHPQDPIRRLYESVELIAKNVMSEYVNSYPMETVASSQTIMLRYEKSNEFKDHVDDCPSYPRVVSMSIFLNDDFVGGELCFKHFGLTVKPRAGDVVVFCSAYPYAHQVNPVERGIRYAAVKWYDYSKKRPS